MGLFDLFSGKKDKSGAQAPVDRAVEETPRRYPSWYGRVPEIKPVNAVKLRAGGEKAGFTAPEYPECYVISDERREEIFSLIDGRETDADTLRFLSLQELLLLFAALDPEDVDDARDDDGQTESLRDKYRKLLKNEVISRVRRAETVFCLYDVTTGYPFLENGCALIYLEKTAAEYAAGIYAGQNRRLKAQECPGEGAQQGRGRGTFFDLLYVIGAGRLIIDNGLYSMLFDRTEIVADPGDWGKKDPMPVNGALVSAMLDFLQEIKWQVGYEQRAQVLKAREAKMLDQIKRAVYLVPTRHEGPAEVLEGGMIKAGPDSRIRFPLLKGENGEDFLPVYTDMSEFSKRFGTGEWMAGVFSFNAIEEYVADKTGFIVNPDGERIFITTQRLKQM